MGLGGASEVVASSVTVGLAEGSGISFTTLGAHEVKGLERPIEIYRVN
jgi:class 3 adenylate cyclase